MSADERRRQLLGVARDLFAEVGFHNTTTAMIASRAGVSEPILYRHFESKLCLFHDILEDILAEARERFEWIAGRGRNGGEKLLAVVEDFPHFSKQQRGLFCMVDRAVAAARDDKTKSLLRAHYDGFEQIVERIVLEGKSDGSVHASVEHKSLSWMLIMTGVGMTLLSGLEHPALQDDALPARLESLVRSMITCP